MQRQGATVLISSHVLEDLAEMCDRVGVISRGTMVCVEETRRMIEERGGRRMRARASGTSEDLQAFLAAWPKVQGLRWDDRSLLFRMEGAGEAELAALDRAGVHPGFPLEGVPSVGITAPKDLQEAHQEIQRHEQDAPALVLPHMRALVCTMEVEKVVARAKDDVTEGDGVETQGPGQTINPRTDSPARDFKGPVPEMEGGAGQDGHKGQQQSRKGVRRRPRIAHYAGRAAHHLHVHASRPRVPPGSTGFLPGRCSIRSDRPL